MVKGEGGEIPLFAREKGGRLVGLCNPPTKRRRKEKNIKGDKKEGRKEEKGNNVWERSLCAQKSAVIMRPPHKNTALIEGEGENEKSFFFRPCFFPFPLLLSLLHFCR